MSINVLFYTLVGLIFLFSVSVYASDNRPMSAIDWLAEKINDPPEFYTLPNKKNTEYKDNDSDISLNHLPGVSKNSIGIFGGERLGLPINIWSDESETTIADAVINMPKSDLFRVNRLFKRILLVETDPPITDIKSDHAGKAFLRARLSKLIAMGALDEAEALIENSNPALDANLIDLWADIAFLTRRMDKFCDTLLDRHTEKDFLAHRVICLARSGDWNAAALALATYSSIGDLDENLELLLINYLDHEAELDLKNQEICLEGSPVLIYLCGFSGVRFSDNELPLEFLYSNLSRSKSLRARINASEEFVKSGALDPAILFSNYRIKSPSTSGGLWARVKLVQELDQKFNMEELEQLELLQNLSLAVQEFKQSHLLTQFSDAYGEKVQNIKLKEVFSKYQEMIVALILLSGKELDYSREYAIKNSNINTAIYIASQQIGWRENEQQYYERILQDIDDLADYELTQLDKVIVEASAGIFPNNRASSEQMEKAFSQQRNGLALFEALSLISKGKQSDMLDLQTGLAYLVKMGLLEDFKTIATEILMMEYFRNVVYY